MVKNAYLSPNDKNSNLQTHVNAWWMPQPTFNSSLQRRQRIRKVSWLEDQPYRSVLGLKQETLSP